MFVKQLKLFINTFPIDSLVFHQVACYDHSTACSVVKNATADKQLWSSLTIVAIEIGTFLTDILKASGFMFWCMCPYDIFWDVIFFETWTLLLVFMAAVSIIAQTIMCDTEICLEFISLSFLLCPNLCCRYPEVSFQRNLSFSSQPAWYVWVLISFVPDNCTFPVTDSS